MKITTLSRNINRAGLKKTQGKSSVSFSVGDGAVKPSAISPTTPSLEVNLSQVTDATSQPFKKPSDLFQSHSTTVLDQLENLHKNVITGTDDASILEDLKTLAKKFPDSGTDPRLQQLKELIEIRIAVELAKRGQF